MAKITHSRECFPKRSSRYGPIPSLLRPTVRVVALSSQGGWAGPACCGSACAGESGWAYLPANPTWTGSRPNIRSAHRRGPVDREKSHLPLTLFSGRHATMHRPLFPDQKRRGWTKTWTTGQRSRARTGARWERSAGNLTTQFTPTTHIDSHDPVSYTHLRAHETDSYLVCRLLLEKKKQTNPYPNTPNHPH